LIQNSMTYREIQMRDDEPTGGQRGPGEEVAPADLVLTLGPFVRTPRRGLDAGSRSMTLQLRPG
jgi:hypothetical protein